MILYVCATEKCSHYYTYYWELWWCLSFIKISALKQYLYYDKITSFYGRKINRKIFCGKAKEGAEKSIQKNIP